MSELDEIEAIFFEERAALEHRCSKPADSSNLQVAIHESMVLPNFQSVFIPFMLAEKNDRIPQKSGPFIWTNLGPTSEPTTTEQNTRSAAKPAIEPNTKTPTNYAVEPITKPANDPTSNLATELTTKPPPSLPMSPSVGPPQSLWPSPPSNQLLYTRPVT